jgi:hypothetical protein
MRLLVVNDEEQLDSCADEIGTEDIDMVSSTSEFIETPDSCEGITEYDNNILENLEIQAEAEQEETDSRRRWDEVEQKFARYERNYRARRIREMTQAPLVVVKSGCGRPSKLAA